MQMHAAELPPDADPRPPPEPPKLLDEAWVTDRRLQTEEMLDWLSDSHHMPGGHAYLTRDAHHDTHAAATTLLETALAACIKAKKTKRDAIGSPACWAVLLAQQAHANQHDWEMDEAGRDRWGVREIHMALETAQSQRVTFEGGSSSKPQSRRMPHGLKGAQQLADKDDGPLTRPIRVDELGDDEDLKKKADFLHQMLLHQMLDGEIAEDGGLHPLILALEPPELRAAAATAATELGAAKQAASQRWGRQPGPSRQAPKAHEAAIDEPTEAAVDSHESQDGSAIAQAPEAREVSTVNEVPIVTSAFRARALEPCPVAIHLWGFRHHHGNQQPVGGMTLAPPSVDTHGTFADRIRQLLEARADSAARREGLARCGRQIVRQRRASYSVPKRKPIVCG
mmetsp:Transcript_30771/g.90176  ORF Transcript_30771/g.90176 Transcript_30771/m.90176 type:complete len:396 (+) Transcript_30771:147-1334(+)